LTVPDGALPFVQVPPEHVAWLAPVFDVVDVGGGVDALAGGTGVGAGWTAVPQSDAPPAVVLFETVHPPPARTEQLSDGTTFPVRSEFEYQTP
jgi:hypothetical protein